MWQNMLLHLQTRHNQRQTVYGPKLTVMYDTTGRAFLRLHNSHGNLSLFFKGVETKLVLKVFLSDITGCRPNPGLFQAENEVRYFCGFQKLPLSYLPPSCAFGSHFSSFLTGKPELIFVLLLTDKLHWGPKVAPLLIHFSYSEREKDK